MCWRCCGTSAPARPRARAARTRRSSAPTWDGVPRHRPGRDRHVHPVLAGWILSATDGTGGYYRNWATADGRSSSWSWLFPDWWLSLWHYEHEVYKFNINLSSPHTYQSNPWSWLVTGRPVSYFYESPAPGKDGCPIDRAVEAMAGLRRGHRREDRFGGVDGQAVSNSWFTGFRNDVAAAAMTEEGGHGGEAAGPIVAAVLQPARLISPTGDGTLGCCHRWD
ncbi:hypothetical protein SALBM311S_06317 [Streptomyces alboniger]